MNKPNILMGITIGLCAMAFLALEWPLTEREKKATMPADLGPETIDVSTYPDFHKINYQLFLQRCSQCHSPARAINSPITTAADWKKYIGLMHTLSLKLWLKPDDRRWLQEFLVYDSKVRKIDHREAFLKQQQELEEHYRKVLSIRARTEQEEKHDNP